MELNQGKYTIMTVTSMGVRITPLYRQPVQNSQFFQMQSTSAESNVLNVSASLGKPVKLLTKFVKDSPISGFIQGELRKRNIAFEGMEVNQEGPWGARHQFNIADSGYGLRGPRVHNDRAGEVGLTLRAEDFDLDEIFQKEGCGIFHLSGLVAALSPEVGQCCLTMAKKAKENHSLLSFDLNYRASFWKNREEELAGIFHEIASMADILIGNEEDFQLALGIEGPQTEGKCVEETERFQEMISRAAEKYSQAKLFATTLRQVLSANEHLWGAIMLADERWYVEQPRPIPVLDRIGGGDGFVGGLLYGISQGWDPETSMKFGWGTGAMAATVLEDYASPVSEEQVWSIYEGNARVKR